MKSMVFCPTFPWNLELVAMDLNDSKSNLKILTKVDMLFE